MCALVCALVCARAFAVLLRRCKPEPDPGRLYFPNDECRARPQDCPMPEPRVNCEATGSEGAPCGAKGHYCLFLKRTALRLSDKLEP